jgi:hypothetical protein
LRQNLFDIEIYAAPLVIVADMDKNLRRASIKKLRNGLCMFDKLFTARSNLCRPLPETLNTHPVHCNSAGVFGPTLVVLLTII